jgi:hypothetical protein
MAKRSGRPTTFKPEYVEQARKLCELGATDEELAGFFEVHVATIYRWQACHPEFCEALKAGKVAANERVERSLYHRAVGYTFDSEKVFQFQGAVVRAPVKEHVPPDTTAAIFWLKNRKPNEWRDKQQIEHDVSSTLEALIRDSHAIPPMQMAPALPAPDRDDD